MKQTEAMRFRAQPLGPSEERELVRRCQTGDVEAFNRIVRAFQDTVYGLAYRLMGNYDDANDLAQEVFLVCFRKFGQYRGDSRLKTWLYRIVVNLAKNAWQRRERRGYSSTVSLDDPPGTEDCEPARQIASGAPGPRQTAAARQTHEALWRSLNQLKPEHREALTLRCMEDLSYEEIAQATECSLGTVKSRINRARAELRKLMEDHL